jgi:hypothetical protein
MQVEIHGFKMLFLSFGLWYFGKMLSTNCRSLAFKYMTKMCKQYNYFRIAYLNDLMI